MAKSLKDANPTTQAAAGVGHNEGPLDRDTFERHVSAILRNRNGPLAMANAAVKSAKKTEKNLKAEAKMSGIKLVQLEAYLKLREMDSESDASENAQAFQQYCQWGELLDGQQGDLFDGLTPTPVENEDRWYKRGFKDIREGAFDLETGPIMPGSPPKYVPTDQPSQQAWLRGASDASEQNNKDFLDKQNTPVETKAKAPPATPPAESAPDAGTAEQAKEEAPPAKPQTQREKDLAASQAKAAELAAKGATNTVQ